MSEETFDYEKVAKGLQALQSIAKGHASGSTSTTAVETMTTQGGATQIYHTPANSDPGSWAGSTGRDVASNGAEDDIDATGTNYGNKGIMKGILEKVEKGMPLTASEFKILKGSMAFGKDAEKEDTEKGLPFGKDKEDDDEDEDDKKDLEKSITEAIEQSGSEELNKGLDVSEFLSDWSTTLTKAMDARHDALFKGLCRYIDRRVSEVQSQNDAVNKSLASALGSVGEATVYTAQRMQQLETSPARGARAVNGLQAIEKGGFNGGGDDYISKALNGDPMAKSYMANTIADMVERKQATAEEAILFDTTGQISKSLLNKLRAQPSL